MTVVSLKWTKEVVLNKMETSTVMLERSIREIYKRQTATEQQSEATLHNNGMGFTGADARFLSSMVLWMDKVSNTRKEGERLSPKQREYSLKKMRKYAGQLVKVIREKEKATQLTLEG